MELDLERKQTLEIRKREKRPTELETARRLYGQGTDRLLKGEYQSALQKFLDARSRYKPLGSGREAGRTLIAMGKVRAFQKDVAGASATYEKALRLVVRPETLTLRARRSNGLAALTGKADRSYDGADKSYQVAGDRAR